VKNPWLQIPACDYEAHMALPEVAQAQALSKLMASVMKEYTPQSLAVIGCTTGNGFEHKVEYVKCCPTTVLRRTAISDAYAERCVLNQEKRKVMAYKFAEKQGQYLAFIYYYTKMHRKPPVESDMQEYFRVSAPSIHQRVVTLIEKGLISREPGQARTIQVLVPENELPKLK
jgi:hypothetical protein